MQWASSTACPTGAWPGQSGRLAMSEEHRPRRRRQTGGGRGCDPEGRVVHRRFDDGHRRTRWPLLLKAERSEAPGEDLDGNGRVGEKATVSIRAMAGSNFYDLGEFEAPFAAGSCGSAGSIDLGDLPPRRNNPAQDRLVHDRWDGEVLRRHPWRRRGQPLGRQRPAGRLGFHVRDRLGLDLQGGSRRPENRRVDVKAPALGDLELGIR